MFWRSCVALILATALEAAPSFEFVSRTRLISDLEHFGGLSGIEMQDGGNQALVLSDRGRLFEVFLDRSSDGATKGSRIKFVGWFGGDSEGLAIREPKKWYVSFEWPARVDIAWKVCLPSHTDFAEMESNRELEALAISPQGHLFTLPEGLPPNSASFPIYRHDGKTWTIPAELPADGDFSPVGADFGPGDWLYILERRIGFWGFQSRVRRWHPTTGALEPVWTSKSGQYDNLEGISVWLDDDGQPRVSLVSDDNFLPFVRMELVEFTLNE